MIMRALYSGLSPSGETAKLSILIFHRVVPQTDELQSDVVNSRQFEEICQWISYWFNVLPLSEAVDRLYSGKLPSRAMCITFDDGYADNLTIAAPILRKHGLPCTFFISTDFIDGGCMWNDVIIESVRRQRVKQIGLADLGGPDSISAKDDAVSRVKAIRSMINKAKYLPQNQRNAFAASIAQRMEVVVPNTIMLQSEQVRSLHRMGFEIGAHTRSHPILATLQPDDARREIEGGRLRLQEITGAPVDIFAYPNGKPISDYIDITVQIVKDLGFKCAVSTSWGVARRSSNRYELPRFTPWDRTRVKFGLRLAQNLTRAPSESSPQS